VRLRLGSGFIDDEVGDCEDAGTVREAIYRRPVTGAGATAIFFASFYAWTISSRADSVRRLSTAFADGFVFRHVDCVCVNQAFVPPSTGRFAPVMFDDSRSPEGQKVGVAQNPERYRGLSGY
jgi:hypothetical protein